MFENSGIEAILGDTRNKFGVLLDFEFNSNPNLSYMFKGVKNYSYIKFTKLKKAVTVTETFMDIGNASNRVTELTIDLSAVTSNLDTLIKTGFSGTGQVPVKILTKGNQTTACTIYNHLKAKYPSVTVTHTDGVTVLDPTKC